jgi:hypothetical protein
VDWELTKVDLNTTLKQSTQDPEDLFALHSQLACNRKTSGDIFSVRHLPGHDFLKETQFSAL